MNSNVSEFRKLNERNISKLKKFERFKRKNIQEIKDIICEFSMFDDREQVFHSSIEKIPRFYITTILHINLVYLYYICIYSTKRFAFYM
jgi:hypothetical protein